MFLIYIVEYADAVIITNVALLLSTTIDQVFSVFRIYPKTYNSKCMHGVISYREMKM